MRLGRRGFMAGGAAALMAGPSGAALPNGHVVPAEEDPHELTLMQWPVSRRVYRDGGFLEDVQRTIARIANSIAAFEPVVMLAGARHHGQARRYLSEAITLWDVPTEDLWARDSGPIVAVGPNGARAVSHIRFNGWGRKQRHVEDGRVAERVATRMGLPLIATGLVGEAGGVEQDGQGLLIAHASSWLGRSRNPGLTEAEIGTRLLAAYGAERLIWAPGLAGEDITDYHIDSLARLTGPGRVLANLPAQPDPGDPFHQAASETLGILRDEGLAVTVIAEPNRPRIREAAFVASYANFYVCNGAVIGAEFGDAETDQAATDALAQHFPDREVVTLNVDTLGLLGGGIHCATHEVPSPRS